MTEFDTAALRQALRVPQDPGDPVDVSQIMTRGRRLRNRRRLAAVAGTVCAVALLAGTASAIADLTAAPSQRVQPVGPARQQSLPPSPARTPHPVRRPTAGLSATPVPVPTPATAVPTTSATPTASAFATTTPTPGAPPSVTPLPSAR
jgi:hypothetical protein